MFSDYGINTVIVCAATKQSANTDHGMSHECHLGGHAMQQLLMYVTM